MFFVSYLAAELRRRKGRTLLTALGLAVGVALVVAVNALSTGLDRAQDEVLEPLTGLGTDMSVTRPLQISGGGTFRGPGAGLSAKERDQLREENGGARVGLRNLGKPGSHFSIDRFLSGTQLSFPASYADKVRKLQGARDAAVGLTLTSLHLSGTVPEEQSDTAGGPRGFAAPAPGPAEGPRALSAQPLTVTGLDPGKASLAPVSPGEVTKGRYLRAGDRHEALLDVAYANRRDLKVGEQITLGGHHFTIVGLVKSPLGGQASDVYVQLAQLQQMSGRAGRANVLYVRATSAGTVKRLAAAIQRAIPGAQATTAKDVAGRVGGSLADARNLSDKLGVALEAIGLAAAFLIAVLLTLASVAKRTRELGTLKAVGWRQRQVVRQVAGESLAQGLLGGLMGAALGIGAAAAIGAFGPTLEATVASAAPQGPVFIGRFGQGAVEAGSEVVKLSAPVDGSLIALAVALALAGGLVAGLAGGLRAARLRPAEALRHVE